MKIATRNAKVSWMTSQYMGKRYSYESNPRMYANSSAVWLSLDSPKCPLSVPHQRLDHIVCIQAFKTNLDKVQHMLRWRYRATQEHKSLKSFLYHVGITKELSTNMTSSLVQWKNHFNGGQCWSINTPNTIVKSLKKLP
jgi:hypothetical protein